MIIDGASYGKLLGGDRRKSTGPFLFSLKILFILLVFFPKLT
jgi:hypothetical protein